MGVYCKSVSYQILIITPCLIKIVLLFSLLLYRLKKFKCIGGGFGQYIPTLEKKGYSHWKLAYDVHVNVSCVSVGL